MPNFKQFIKGFEEPEAQPKADPKPQEVKAPIKPEAKSETDYSKPYKTFGGKEYFVKPYSDFQGNKRFDIRSRKEGGEFDIGSRAGYDFKSEDEARKTIDEWEQYHKPQPKTKSGPRFQRAKQPQQGSFEQMAKSFDEPEQKQFSKEEIALADKTADYLDNYLGFDGFEVRKLPDGNYLTNVHLGDPDVEPEEVGPEVMLAKYKELIEGGVDPKEIA